MSGNALFYIILLLLSVFISSLSQVMLKKAATKEYKNKFAEYTNPLVIVAYTIFFCCTLLTVWAYKVVPLSLGPILEATSYFYVTIWGVKIFGEKINRRKIIALAFIVIGIIIYGIEW